MPFHFFPTQLNAEQILESISGPFFDIGTEVVMEQKQHLSSPDNPSSSGFGLFESIDLASEVS